MTSKRVVVTGAHSYLGQKLLQHLLMTGGFEIAAFITPWADDAVLIDGDGVTYYNVDLRGELPGEAAEAVNAADRVLHFAWVRDKDEEKALGENLKMFENLRDHLSNPERLVFVSSVSASPETLSGYGRTKFKVAKELAKYGAVILVTGLVVDKEPRGPYKLLVSVVKKLPVSVRFTRNSVKVYPIRTDDFLNGIVTILTQPIGSGSYRLYPSNPADINEFLAQLENRYRRARVPVPVSYKLSIRTLNFLKGKGLLPASLGEKLLTFLYKDEAYLATHETLPGTETLERSLSEMI